MNDLNDNQRRYILQRRNGHGITESAQRAKVGRSTVAVWRHDRQFKKLDDQTAREAGSEQPDTVPVSIEQFVCDPRYLNKARTIRPVVLDALKAIEAGDFHTILATGAVGAGKTTLLQYLIEFEIYLLSTIDNPHERFSLDPDTPIIFAIQNRTTTLAEQNDFATISATLAGSPYFQSAFPMIKRPTRNRLHFRNRIEVWATSGDFRAILGMNPIVAMMDEANYMDVVEKSTKGVDGGGYDQAKEMFAVAQSRQQSRFYLYGQLHSKILVGSSATCHGAFTEVIENEARSDPGIYVWKKSIWQARPEHYSAETFPVFIGDASRDPHILKPDDEIESKDRPLIIHAPVNFRKDAGRDIFKFLQDCAGVPIRSAAAFFTDREQLAAAFKRDSILNRDSIISGEPIMILRERITHPDRARFIHLDLSKSKNATGLAVGYISHFVEIDRGGTQETLPFIVIEAALQIRPPRNGEIDYSLIRSLIYSLREYVNVVAIRADQFQSTDMLQELARHGFAVGHLSVDRGTDPYLTFKDAVADNRIVLPRNPVLHREAMNVQIDYQKGKVDHPVNGSKDVLDSVVGVTTALSKDKMQWVNHGVMDRLIPKLGSRVTPIVKAPDDLAPFMKDSDPILRQLRNQH